MVAMGPMGRVGSKGLLCVICNNEKKGNEAQADHFRQETFVQLVGS